MKVLCKTVIFSGLFIMLIGCKHEGKKTEEFKETGKAAIEQSQEIEKNKKITQTKNQSIDDFLTELQMAIENNDKTDIIKSVKIPFEFKSGGESELYESAERVIKNPYFKKIIKAKFEKIEANNRYAILYQQPNVEDFFIYYYAIKDGDGFKLTSMEMPH
ncbi:hypothetical protein ACSTS3_15070 [Aquimarina muelleri]|uniref:hypothetical protein n=1 Tax=Aquimarina muelleri TaxID=279356 RepID=UPI003F684B10